MANSQARRAPRRAVDWERLVHELNQRYRREFDRAERLQAELTDLHRSRWWPLVRTLRRWRAWWTSRVVRPAAPSTESAGLPAGFVPQTLVPAGPCHGRVSIIVPFRDQLALLRNLLRGLQRTTYPDVEIILVDNGSVARRMRRFLARWGPPQGTVVSQPGPFNFAALANAGARQASGRWLLFLNNDIEVLHASWLAGLVRLAATPGVGIAGATLLYPDRSIQHAGLFPVGAPPGPVVWEHRHRFRPRTAWRRDPELTTARTVPAVTAACLLCSRDLFTRLGGFAECYPLTHNDVDLCVRSWAAGYQVAVTPEARLVHYESLSRGYCKDA